MPESADEDDDMDGEGEDDEAEEVSFLRSIFVTFILFSPENREFIRIDEYI